MLGFKILIHVVAVFFALVIIVAFGNSISKGRHIRDRYVDILVGVVVFLLFCLLIKFGGSMP